jgi:two-component system cell cycle sensor histidine kinase/response regulator CckA
VSSPGTPVRQFTILVVEDNPITRRMFRFALESEGYQTLEAADGQSALNLALAAMPSLVVLDYVLPDTDALRLLEQLRELPGGATLPVLIVSGMLSRLGQLEARQDPHTILLPKPVEPSRLAAIVKSQLGGPKAIPSGGKRVLVVDDEPLGRKLAALRLKDAGFEVELAGDGLEALGTARTLRPDAVLSDVLMPHLDGFLLCEALRREPLLKDVPVVLLSSAYVDDADRLLAQQMGANALIERTPDLADAIHALREGLRDRGPAATSAPEQWTSLHRERVQVQLERQITRNERLLQQSAIQAAALSVIRGLSEALARPQDLPAILGDVLVHCLDAAGLSIGMLYLAEPDGTLRLRAQTGLSQERGAAAAEGFGDPEFLKEAIAGAEPVTCTSVPSETQPAARCAFAARVGSRWVLVIPFVAFGERLGALLLASDSIDLSEPAWTDCARALAAQFGQTIALGRTLARGASSEARYRSLMEQAHDAILVLDASFRVLEANRAAEALLGAAKDAIQGRPYLDFVPQEEQHDAEAARKKLVAEGVLWLRDRGVARADGSRVPVDVSASIVRVGDEDLVLAVFRDISERKRAETELRQAHQREHRLVSSSPAVLYSLRIVGDKFPCTWVSDNVERVTGHSVAQALAPGWWAAHVHPDDRERVFAQGATLLEEGRIVREYRFRISSGEYRWIRDEQRLLRDEADQPFDAVGSWSDVTERKLAELKLRESEEQYRLLFDGNPLPMWVYDPETLAFLAVNDAALRNYGWSRDEFLGMTIKDIRPPHEIPAMLEAVKDTSPRMRGSATWKHWTKDGLVREVTVAANAITFHGRPARLVLADDVTETRKLETQLMQAQKMEAVGRLAGGIAHDFNNLLGVIVGFNELLAKDLGAAHKGRKRVEQIRKAAERASALTRQLLAFSRKQVLQPAVIEISDVVADVEKMLRRLIGEDVTLVTTLGSVPGLVKADRGQIEQVIVNLAVNARDAMPHGGTLILETSNVEVDDAYTNTHTYVKPGSYVMLAVSDTGQGMEASTLSHLFEPFFTTKEPGKGTGLGLATVFGIVKQSGGHINVYSEPGRGSTFKVYLPRVDATGESALPLDSEPAPGGHETVLLVEDEEALRGLIREMLEGASYTVLEAGCPKDALAMTASHEGPIHLLLTDVIQPGMSGAALAARMKELRPETRVLYMSGYTDEAIGHHGVLEPGTNFLQKPFTSDTLLRKVRDVLDAPAL